MKCKCTPFPNGPVDPKQMLAAKQHRHLLALYLSACDYADKLRRALVQGESPTEYGSPLTPIDAEQAVAILADVDKYLTLMREYVSQHAPDELAAHELPQPQANTLVWASNLIERLRQIANDMSPAKLKKSGEEQSEVFRDTEQLQKELLTHIEQARRLVRDVAAPDSDDTD